MKMQIFILFLVLQFGIYSCKKADESEPDAIFQTFHTIDLSETNYYEELTCGSQVILDAGVANATYLWTPGGDTTQTKQIDETLFSKKIRVSITTQDSSWVDSVYVYQYYGIEIPNSFTPNGDGINDRFHTFTSCVSEYNLKIFNNFNSKLLFESNDPEADWDGTHKNYSVPPGEYYYNLEVEFYNGTTESLHGTIWLIR